MFVSQISAGEKGRQKAVAEAARRLALAAKALEEG
jgi:hypothetical protein